MSAGLLLFRLGDAPNMPGNEASGVEVPGSRPAAGRGAAGVEVLIAFPGGPFYAHRGDGSWTVPKGEYGTEEEPLAAACREFTEELGSAPPDGERIDLGTVTQRGGKVVHVWAVEGDLDTSTVVSNEFEMEWPPHSGSRQRFPEVARAEWASPEEARRMLLPAQTPFVDRLEAALQDRRRP